jgi:hypothetical protein
MKEMKRLCLPVLTACFLTASTLAFAWTAPTPLSDESFNYGASGELINQVGGTGWFSAWYSRTAGQDIDIVNNRAQYTGPGTFASAARRLSWTFLPGHSYYVSFDMYHPSAYQWGTGHNSRVSLYAGSDSTLYEIIDFGALGIGGADKWQMRGWYFDRRNLSTTARVPFVKNQSAHIVLFVQLSNATSDSLYAWINPDTTDTTATADLAIPAISLRKGPGSVESDRVSLEMQDAAGAWVDNLSFADRRPWDTTPSSVRNLRSRGADQCVQLDWDLPLTGVAKSMRVVRRVDRYPATPTDGIIVSDRYGVNFTNTGLTNGAGFYYAVFAYNDENPASFSPIATVTGMPRAGVALNVRRWIQYR